MPILEEALVYLTELGKIDDFCRKYIKRNKDNIENINSFLEVLQSIKDKKLNSVIIEVLDMLLQDKGELAIHIIEKSNSAKEINRFLKILYKQKFELPTEVEKTAFYKLRNLLDTDEDYIETLSIFTNAGSLDFLEELFQEILCKKGSQSIDRVIEFLEELKRENPETFSKFFSSIESSYPPLKNSNLDKFSTYLRIEKIPEDKKKEYENLLMDKLKKDGSAYYVHKISKGPNKDLIERKQKEIINILSESICNSHNRIGSFIQFILDLLKEEKPGRPDILVLNILREVTLKVLPKIKENEPDFFKQIIMLERFQEVMQIIAPLVVTDGLIKKIEDDFHNNKNMKDWCVIIETLLTKVKDYVDPKLRKKIEDELESLYKLYCSNNS